MWGAEGMGGPEGHGEGPMSRGGTMDPPIPP